MTDITISPMNDLPPADFAAAQELANAITELVTSAIEQGMKVGAATAVAVLVGVGIARYYAGNDAPIEAMKSILDLERGTPLPQAADPKGVAS